MSRYLKVKSQVNDGVGHNRWVRCKFCGSLNDVLRTSVGDGTGIEVVEETTFNGEPMKYLGPSEADNQLYFDDPDVLLKMDYDGSPMQSTKHVVKKPLAVGGCFFCGSKNYNR